MPAEDKKDPSPLKDAVQMLAKPVGIFLTAVLPVLIKGGAAAVAFYQTLPQNCIHFLIGFTFCFFGGIYPVLFAAVQAAEHGGRQKLVESIRSLAQEAMVIIDESKKDDKVDADNDGKSDVQQISGGEYLQRKTMLVFRKMNPEKVRIVKRRFVCSVCLLAAFRKLTFSFIICVATAGYRVAYYVYRLAFRRSCTFDPVRTNGKYRADRGRVSQQTV